MLDSQTDSPENGGLREVAESVEKFGGADGDRTHGLLNAIQALSQLSYSPTWMILYNVYSRLSIRLKSFEVRLTSKAVRFLYSRLLVGAC